MWRSNDLPPPLRGSRERQASGRGVAEHTRQSTLPASREGLRRGKIGSSKGPERGDQASWGRVRIGPFWFLASDFWLLDGSSILTASIEQPP
jgi:hypothetical protein